LASYSLLLQCPRAESEFVSAELYGLGTAGITERDLPGGVCELEAFFAERFDAAPLFGRFAPEWREQAATPWVDTFEPLVLGSRLFLVPGWRDGPTPEGRLRLTVHARQASGSGYQPATQLALEALERHLRPGDRFLDVGTGSGILSAAAALLGAGARFACDLDLAALGEARENATPAQLFGGSARAVAAGAVNVAAANLNAEALLSLGGELPRVLAPGGRLILSGFRSRSVDRLASAFPLEVLETLASGDWRALVLAV
jgi:ribosomal protein L11 methyltransferase